MFFLFPANCILQSAEPIAPVKKKFADKEWTDWDFIDVKRGDITLATFIKFMKVRQVYGWLQIHSIFLNKIGTL